MDILSIIGSLNNAAEMKRIGQKVYDQFQPVNEAMDSARTGIANTLGITKEIVDPGDASMRTVPDQEAIRDRMDNFAEVSSQMRPQFYDGPTLLQSGQAPMQPMGFPNPYTSGNYGTMQPQMTGGIGSAPTIDQILAALQARQ